MRLALSVLLFWVPVCFGQGNGANGKAAQVKKPEKKATCQYKIDGQVFEGYSQRECQNYKQLFDVKNLKKQIIKARPQKVEVKEECEYDVDGKVYRGQSAAECDRLAQKLGIDSEKIEASKEYQCEFEINQKVFKGKSKTECDQLKKRFSSQP